MPYEIKKVPGGYFVVNTETGKKHSLRPMTKMNAQAQLTILRITEARERRIG